MTAGVCGAEVPVIIENNEHQVDLQIISCEAI